MGEQKDKEEALRKQQEALRKQQEEFQKMLETPLTQEEANASIAKIDMQKAQLAVVRLSLMERVASIDAQIAQAEYDRTIVIHRAMLPAKKEPAKPVMGQPTGGKKD